MIGRWQERGRIDRCSVTHVVLSPRYDEDQTLAVVTPAGLAISRDAGERWETPARGIVGPFVRELVWSASSGTAGVLLASTPSGLWRSFDGGGTWDGIASTTATGPLLPLADGVVLLASETDGMVWHIQPDDLAPQPVGGLAGSALALAGTDEDIDVWAATTAGVFVSRDEGATWDLVWHEDEQSAQTVARCDRDSFVIGTASDGVRIRRGFGWESPATLRGYDIAAIASSPDGDLIAAGGSAGVFVSRDGGASWEGPRLGRPVLSLAERRDGSQIWAGLVNGGCARSSDRGENWELVSVPDGSVIVDVQARADRMVARTAEDFVVESCDGGATWPRGPLLDEVRVQAVAIPPAPSSPVYATDTGLLSEHDGEIRPLHDGAFAHLAISERASGLIVAATARDVIHSPDHGRTWEWLDLPLAEGAEIVDLAVGDGPNDEPGEAIAVATLTGGGQGTVWLRLGAAPCRRAIVHPVPAPTARLAATPGPRGLFAAIGDSIYRPARLGAALFAREVVAVGKSAQVLQIAAVRDEDDPILVALTTTGLFLSRDGGMIWEDLPGPPGPPVTALTLRQSEGGHEVVAALLGGEVRTLQIS